MLSFELTGMTVSRGIGGWQTSVLKRRLLEVSQQSESSLGKPCKVNSYKFNISIIGVC
jgi:hypothetical protein